MKELMSDMRAKYVILGVSIIALAGIIGAVNFSSTISAYQVSDVASTMMGHVTIAVQDEFGNIKSYQQTDNLVTTEGRDCAIENLFGTLAANTCPVSVQAGTYRNVALGSNPAVVALADTRATPVQVAIAVADTVTQATVGATEVVTITKAFTAVAVIGPNAVALENGDTVAETALYDGAVGGVTDNMLARKDLSSVTVVTGDTVTITWIITVS